MIDDENYECNEILPKPPLFSHNYHYQDGSQEVINENEDDAEDNINHNKWKMFNELRQKKKKILKEQNPY